METKPTIPDQPNALTSPHAGPSGSLESLVKREDVGRVDRLIVDESVRRKRKWSGMGYGPEEIDRKEKTVTSYQLALLQDQQSTLFPAAPTVFTSHHDAVDRLLPYHVWQIHDEELDGQGGKRDAIRAQKDKNDAKVLTGMLSKIKDRYTRIRRREGMFPSDLPSMINLINNSTHQVRTELDAVQAAQRTARTQFETLEAVRRARERLTSSAYPRPPGTNPTAPTTPARPSSSSFTTQPSTTSIATQSSPARPGSTSGHVSTERGRGRGRPRGRGRGGAPTPSTSHISTPLAQTPVATPQSSSTPSSSAGKDDPGIVAKIKGGLPFKVNVPTSSLPHLIEVGIITDPNATPSKRVTDPPAVVVDKSTDGKLTGISMNLKKCNQAQLLVMAKVLNIKLDLIKPATGAAAAPAGTSSASPSTPAAKPPPPPAEPPRTDPNKRTRSSTTSST